MVAGAVEITPLSVRGEKYLFKDVREVIMQDSDDWDEEEEADMKETLKLLVPNQPYKQMFAFIFGHIEAYQFWSPDNDTDEINFYGHTSRYYPGRKDVNTDPGIIQMKDFKAVRIKTLEGKDLARRMTGKPVGTDLSYPEFKKLFHKVSTGELESWPISEADKDRILRMIYMGYYLHLWDDSSW